MEDEELIGLYFGRDENAIKATSEKYGSRLRALAYRLLDDNSDVEECLNDTWFKVWNAIPPNSPENMYAFCAAVCRRTAISVGDALWRWIGNSLSEGHQKGLRRGAEKSFGQVFG